MNANGLPHGPSMFELHKMQIELEKFQADRKEARWRGAWGAANAAGRTAVNALLLASGGAVVALLAFLGSMLSKDTSHDYSAQFRVSLIVKNVGLALQPFVISLFVAVLAAAFIYLSMFLAAGAVRDDSKRLRLAGDIFNYLAICAGIASLVALGNGAHIGLAMLRAL